MIYIYIYIYIYIALLPPFFRFLLSFNSIENLVYRYIMIKKWKHMAHTWKLAYHCVMLYTTIVA